MDAYDQAVRQLSRELIPTRPPEPRDAALRRAFDDRPEICAQRASTLDDALGAWERAHPSRATVSRRRAKQGVK